MTPEEQLMKSMVDHPAGTGRHRRQPTPVDCLGPTRDVPAPGTAFDAVGLILAIFAAIALVAVAGVIGGHLAGPAGAIIAAGFTAVSLTAFIRQETK